MLMNIFAWIVFALFAGAAVFGIWLENSGESKRHFPENNPNEQKKNLSETKKSVKKKKKYRK